MKLFVSVFSLYGLLHLYLYVKITSAFTLPLRIRIPLFILFVFMTISPVLIHRFAPRKPLGLSRLFGYIGYLWMSVVFFFFIQVILIEAYNFLLYLAQTLFTKDLWEYSLVPPLSLYIPFFNASLLTMYGYYEARRLKTERLTILTPKLPAEWNKLTIVQLSDFHLGLFVREHMLKQVADVVKKVEPDIIVSSGDLVDMDLHHFETLTEQLKTLPARLGKFASLGNHEVFLGIKNSESLIKRAGFSVLRNRGITIHNTVTIAGIDDSLAEYIQENPEKSPAREQDVLSGLPRDIFTILLKHRPDINRDSLGLYDLQLSGHTHKGQVFPANIFIQLFLHPHSTGFVKLYKGSSLYVSRGIGTTACPVRFFSPPEITIFDIVRSKGSEVTSQK